MRGRLLAAPAIVIDSPFIRDYNAVGIFQNETGDDGYVWSVWKERGKSSGGAAG